MKQESFAEANSSFIKFINKIIELINEGYIIDLQLFIYPSGYVSVGEYSIIAHKSDKK